RRQHEAGRHRASRHPREDAEPDLRRGAVRRPLLRREPRCLSERPVRRVAEQALQRDAVLHLRHARVHHADACPGPAVGHRIGARTVCGKLTQALVTIFAIVVLNFVLFRMMPGSPMRATKNPHLSPEFVAPERAKSGLDKPLYPDQLVPFLQSTATGDLGYSI